MIRRRRSPLRLISNLDRAPDRYLDEIKRAGIRALKVGAKPPFAYQGIGMTAVVLCDSRGHGFKVARRPDQAINRAMIAEEAEWLTVASTLPELKGKIARLRYFHKAESIIERECIRERGESRRRSKDTRRETHAEIEAAMRRYGWSAPEYKDDSYVNASGRGWVLVDASMPHRTGLRLAAHAAEILRGRRFAGYGDKPSVVAWELRMEGGKSLPQGTAESLSRKLLALPDAERTTGEREAARRRKQATGPILRKRPSS